MNLIQYLQELNRLRNSKFIQSFIGDERILQEIKDKYQINKTPIIQGSLSQENSKQICIKADDIFKTRREKFKRNKSKRTYALQKFVNHRIKLTIKISYKTTTAH